MSRSNPTVNTPNPATCWFEWNGEAGNVRYFDKEAANPQSDKKGRNIDLPDGFTFILLDETATVKGWRKQTNKGLYANEVRSIGTDVLVVKEFKGETIATGLYSAIKERVKLCGGHFVANLYLAHKSGNELVIGALQLKGAGLNAWMEFRNRHRKAIYEKAVQIKGCTEGRNGNVTFKIPTFHLKDTTEATNAKAIELDKQLQEYLKGYFARMTTPEATNPPAPAAQGTEEDQYAEAQAKGQESEPEYDTAPPTEEDVPF